MSKNSDSNARCLKAIELTFRFVLTCFVPLGFLLLAVCLLFEKGYRPGLNVALVIVVTYFIVAHNFYGRSDRVSWIIGGLAGLTGASPAAEVNGGNDAGESNMDFNPATGLMMLGDFDTSGNLYGFGTISGGSSSDDISMSNDYNHSFNPANGLPMIDDATDIHGNMFCTNSADDLMHHGGSMFDDSLAHTSLGNGFNTGPFDDDWNK